MVCQTVCECLRSLLQSRLVSAESPPGRPPNGGVRAFAKKLAWPARRFFDPRFTAVLQELDGVKRIVAADAAAANEIATFTGRSLDTVLAHVEEHSRALDAVNTALEQLGRRVAFDADAPHSLEEIDENTARMLNYASSHEGFAAQANLWFNPALLVAYAPQQVELRWVNERIVEVPYAFRALSDLQPGAKVLEVGATESSVCLSLATLGYEVTAVDPRPNPLSHERLRVVAARIEEWDHEAAFDAVLCLSTIEHIGVAAYEQEASENRPDVEAMRRIRELTRPDGLLVLTTAVGKRSLSERGRVYDREALDELLAGWDVTDLTLVQRRDATTWDRIDQPVEKLKARAETVAMITATKTAV
jgi:2-polyprenyl-3-methyl-5-hydroxy-6-metoxy-1,4-benzoquinol methylase